jgi:hypothetical protein
MKICPSDLPDAQWQVIKDLFPEERKRKHSFTIYCECYFVNNQIRVPMAHVTEGLCAMADCLLLFQIVEVKRAVRRTP